jgi:hypothetical protein
VAFALAALADPVRSPVASLRGALRPTDGLVVTALAATEGLRLLPGLVADPSAHRRLWEDEMTAFDASRRALDAGWAVIEERPEHDVAIVSVDVTHPDAPRATWRGRALHPAAVHTATSMLRVLTVADRHYELRYRYESWVRLVTHRPRPRVDLDGMANELSQRETAGATWLFDGVRALTGALHLEPGAESTLRPEDFIASASSWLARLDAEASALDPAD